MDLLCGQIHFDFLMSTKITSLALLLLSNAKHVVRVRYTHLAAQDP